MFCFIYTMNFDMKERLRFVNFSLWYNVFVCLTYTVNFDPIHAHSSNTPTPHTPSCGLSFLYVLSITCLAGVWVTLIWCFLQTLTQKYLFPRHSAGTGWRLAAASMEILAGSYMALHLVGKATAAVTEGKLRSHTFSIVLTSKFCNLV